MSLNNEEKYSSLGKKLSLYLITKKGEIYQLFPFICPEVILDKKEEAAYRELKQKRSSLSKETLRTLSIIDMLRNSQTRLLQEDQEEDERER